MPNRIKGVEHDTLSRARGDLTWVRPLVHVGRQTRPVETWAFPSRKCSSVHFASRLLAPVSFKPHLQNRIP